MQQEPTEHQNPPVLAESPVRGVAVPTEKGYQVMEGKGALVNRNSLIFTVGRTVSLLGDNLFLATLNIWLTSIIFAGVKTPAQQAGAAATLTAIQAGYASLNYLAQLVVYPFAGVFVDRWNRRTTMIVTDIVQAALALLPLAVFFVAKDAFIPTLYVTFFLLISVEGFFTQSQGGVLQVIIARKNLPQGLSALNILLAVGAIGATLFAPAFFLAVGAAIAILFNSASFLVSAASLFFMHIPRQAVYPYAYRQSDAPAASVNIGTVLLQVLKDLLTGLRFVFSARVVLAVAIMLAVGNAGAAVNVVFTGFTIANLHLNPKTDLALLGVLPAALGAGAIVGALFAGFFARYVPAKVLDFYFPQHSIERGM